jgi:SOS-response transcriptional repressor LexA
MTLTPGLNSQMQVAKRTGVSQSTVGRILRGEVNPSVEATLSIAKEFGVDLYELYLPHETFSAFAKSESQIGLKRTGSSTFDPRSKGLVPLIDWRQAAGKWSPTDVKEWVLCPVPAGNRLYALDVKGLGMFDPTGPLSFREGDRIFVDQARQAHHRALVIVHLANGEEAAFRQLLREEGKWLLLQLNPSLPQRMATMDVDDRLLGVVVAKVEKFD